MIDDHDIISHYAPGTHHYSFARLKSDLSEISYIEPGGRFRPGLHIIKLAQIYLFQKEVRYWRGAAFVGLIATAFFFYRSFLLFLSPLFATLITLLCFAGTHAESWMRLLSTEAWGMFFYALGFSLILPRKRGETANLGKTILAVLALWIAALTKESFLPLFPLTLFAAFFLYPAVSAGSYSLKNTFSLIQFRFLAASIGIGLFIHLYCLYLALQDLSPRYLILDTAERWLTVDANTWLWFCENGWILPILFLGLELILFIENRFRVNSLWLKEHKVYAQILFWPFLIWFLPQWIVYGNVVHFLQHYMLPINLFVVAAAALTVKLAQKRVRADWSLAVMIIMVFSLLGYEAKWFEKIEWYASKRAKSSRDFQHWIGLLAQEKKSHENVNFIYCTPVAFLEHHGSIAHFLSERLGEPVRPYLYVDWSKHWMNPKDPSVAWLHEVEKTGGFFFRPRIEFKDPKAYYIGISFAGTSCPFPVERLENGHVFDR